MERNKGYVRQTYTDRQSDRQTDTRTCTQISRQTCQRSKRIAVPSLQDTRNPQVLTKVTKRRCGFPRKRYPITDQKAKPCQISDQITKLVTHFQNKTATQKTKPCLALLYSYPNLRRCSCTFGTLHTCMYAAPSCTLACLRMASRG